MSLASARRSTRPRLGSLRRRVGGYLALARVSNGPTVVTNVLAAAALAGALAPTREVVLLAAAMTLFYTAGMFLNDLCDYDVDLRERPERPLPSGTVSRVEAALTAAALFAAGAGLLLYVGAAPFLCGLALISVIALYDVWHKSNPLAPLLMAAARFMVYVVVFVALARGITTELLTAGGLLALYIVALTQIARGETAPALVRYWPAAALLLPAVYFAAGGGWSPALALLFAGWVAYSASFVYLSRGRSIGGGVARLIAGVSLYDALVLAAAGAALGAAVAVALFSATLYLQRHVSGT